MTVYKEQTQRLLNIVNTYIEDEPLFGVKLSNYMLAYKLLEYADDISDVAERDFSSFLKDGAKELYVQSERSPMSIKTAQKIRARCKSEMDE